MLRTWLAGGGLRRERARAGIPPEPVELPRAHIRQSGTTPDARIFQTSRGGIIQDLAYSAVSADARARALTSARRLPTQARHMPAWSA